MWKNTLKVSATEWNKQRNDLITHYAYVSNDDINRRGLITDWSIGMAYAPLLPQLSLFFAPLRHAFTRSPHFIAFELTVITFSCLTGVVIGKIRKGQERAKVLQALAVRMTDENKSTSERASMAKIAHELIKHLGLSQNETKSFQELFSTMAANTTFRNARNKTAEDAYEMAEHYGFGPKLPKIASQPAHGIGQKI